MSKAEYYINKLNLSRHLEDGWYKEIYKSEEIFPAEHLPERFEGKRHHATSIYFLLQSGEFSAFHRIKSDETWHFYEGTAVTVHMIDADGNYSTAKVGRNIEGGEVFQFTVPFGTWFAAEVEEAGSFALVGCTIAPGFHFNDFEMGKREMLLKQYPAYTEKISKFCGL